MLLLVLHFYDCARTPCVLPRCFLVAYSAGSPSSWSVLFPGDCCGGPVKYPFIIITHVYCLNGKFLRGFTWLFCSIKVKKSRYTTAYS